MVDFIDTRKNFPDAQKLSRWQCHHETWVFLTLLKPPPKPPKRHLRNPNRTSKSDFWPFFDFGHFPIEIPIEVEKMLGRAFQTCNLKNCSELLITIGMGLDRAPFQFLTLVFLDPPMSSAVLWKQRNKQERWTLQWQMYMSWLICIKVKLCIKINVYDNTWSLDLYDYESCEIIHINHLSLCLEGMLFIVCYIQS